MTISDIALTVGKEFGPMAAISVYAAIEVAQTHWKDEDTANYGNKIKQFLDSLERAV